MPEKTSNPSADITLVEEAKAWLHLIYIYSYHVSGNDKKIKRNETKQNSISTYHHLCPLM